MDCNVIMPISQKDVSCAKLSMKYVFQYIRPKRIIIIANSKLKNEFHMDQVEFIDEDQMVKDLNLDCIRKLLAERMANIQRSGWYFQQFLKMAYAKVCKDEYYLIWDSDTIPLRKIHFFIDNKPCLDLKKEYCEGYFSTIYQLLGLRKKIDKSFICEHMLINTTIMLDLIDKIEKRNQSVFYEAIISNIADKDINGSGFSEFETYGTYVLNYYEGFYKIRNSKKVLRHGKRYLMEPSESNLAWAAKSYWNISFEDSDTISKLSGSIKKHKVLMKIPLKWLVMIECGISKGVPFLSMRG